MMQKLLLALAILAAAFAQEGGSLDTVITQIFGKPDSSTSAPATPAPVGGASTLVPWVPPSTNEVEECSTPEGEKGECVSYYLCNVNNNTIIIDGAGVIDIRVRDGPCANYLDSCCLVQDKREPNNPVTPAPKPDEPVREGCGWLNKNGVGMLTIGHDDGETKFGEFPWMVAILKIEPVSEGQPDSQQMRVYVGGGSLIHPSVVLTAAHYVATAKQLGVRAGEWDTQSTKEIFPHQDRTVSNVVVHKDFNKGNLFYDIALLFLEQPMNLAPNVGLACLPKAKERAPAGARCFATGWGKDKFGSEGRYQVIMKKIEVPVVDRNTCLAQLRKTRLGRHFELHSSFMCAGGEAGKDTCKGDGGSPLVCPVEDDPGRYVQNGIVAWGIGCGEDGTPGVYVDVANLRDWIDDKIVGRGLEINTYSF